MQLDYNLEAAHRRLIDCGDGKAAVHVNDTHQER